MAKARTYRPVEDLTLEELRAEAWFWREEAAAGISNRLAELKAGRTGHFVLHTRRIADLGDLLDAVLTGETVETCFICAKQIRPGAAVINDVNEGDAHAECMAAEWREGDPPIRPGDKVKVDPECIVYADGHEPPEGERRDYIVAHEASRLYTHERLIARVEAALRIERFDAADPEPTTPLLDALFEGLRRYLAPADQLDARDALAGVLAAHDLVAREV